MKKTSRKKDKGNKSDKKILTPYFFDFSAASLFWILFQNCSFFFPLYITKLLDGKT